MDYFENISLSGFTDGKTDERIIICEDDKFVYGNNLPKKCLGRRGNRNERKKEETTHGSN